MKMNPEVKTKWVEALRSGDYEQGRTYLNNDGKFCCLGVLSEIAVAEGVITSKVSDEGMVRYGGIGDWSQTGPNRAVCKWAGIASNPELGKEDAMGLNDNLGYTFDQIADEIVTHL